MPTTTEPTVATLILPIDVVRHVLWFFGDTGYGVEPGSFTSRLLSTISAADMGNRALLATAFPDLVAAMNLAQHQEGGLEHLRTVAKRSAS